MYTYDVFHGQDLIGLIIEKCPFNSLNSLIFTNKFISDVSKKTFSSKLKKEIELTENLIKKLIYLRDSANDLDFENTIYYNGLSSIKNILFRLKNTNCHFTTIRKIYKDYESKIANFIKKNNNMPQDKSLYINLLLNKGYELFDIYFELDEQKKKISKFCNPIYKYDLLYAIRPEIQYNIIKNIKNSV